MTIPFIETITNILPEISGLEQLRTGGQKVVFKGNHIEYGQVVVKLVRPDKSNVRIKREIDILTTNRFPNVPQIYSWGETTVDDEGILWIIEQFVSGKDLRTRLQENGTLPFSDAMKLITDLLETIAALERCEVVHRDIKPENIICCEDGKFWLVDFGIARDLGRESLTDTANHFGPHTVGYSAPEQFRNMKKRIDSKTDLFSIGIVAYEALSGNHPFATGARDYLDILRRTEALHITPLSLPEDSNGELGQFINILMEKYPSRRPPTAAIARDWFTGILSNLDI